MWEKELFRGKNYRENDAKPDQQDFIFHSYSQPTSNSASV